MPELPEVETIRRTLEPRLVGRVIRGVWVHRRDVVTHGPGGAATAYDLLNEARIVSLERHGKQLAIIAQDGRAICVHLGMSGQLYWQSGVGPIGAAGHVHLVWGVEGQSANGKAQDANKEAGRLVFRDPRRFGGVWTFRNVSTLREQRWGELGVDGLEVTGADLQRALGKSKRAVKSALLDERAVAGVGNIYADEALFEAKIRPRKKCATLKEAEWERLAAAIRATLRASVKAGGTTLRDYVDGEGNPGGYRESHAVYGRAGEKCVVCRGTLRGIVLGQRATVYCPRCQSARG